MIREHETATSRHVALSVVVPVYNEGATLAAHIRELTPALEGLAGAPAWELVLVDDGSVDGTLGAAMRLATADPRIAVCIHDKNYGIARAMMTGATAARGDYVLVLDADLSYAPDQVAKLWATARASGADIVAASAFMPGGGVSNVPALRRSLSAAANWFLSLASDGRWRTLTCMVRVYRTNLLRELLASVAPAALLPEMLFEAHARGAHVIEVPATLQWRAQRRAQSRFKPAAALRYALAIVRCALARRPALWLAIPGLVPGLLPAMAALVFLLHFSAGAAAAVLAATVVVQYASLLVLGVQGVRFLSRRAQQC